MRETDSKLVSKKRKIILPLLMLGPLHLFVLKVPLDGQDPLRVLVIRVTGIVLVSLALLTWILWQIRDELRAWRRTGKRPALM